MNDKIKCEKCQTTDIGEYDRPDKVHVNKVFYPGVKICPKCKAEFCAKCYGKMQKCFCCGNKL